MARHPTFEAFRDLSANATLVPVWREILFDTDTAVSAYRKISRGEFGFLLESVVGGERWARYSFLGTEPRGAWRLRGRSVETWTPTDGWSPPIRVEHPLDDFDALTRRHVPADVPDLPRFWGGAVGYFGYDMVRQMERLPERLDEGLGLPDALFLLTGVVVAIDNLFGRAYVISPVKVAGVDEPELRRRFAAAEAEVERTVERLHASELPPPLGLRPPPAGDPEFRSTFTREGFERAVRRAKEYILAGDIFQVVLSQRITVPLAADPFDLYRALRSLNPSPYLFYLELGEFSLVGSSPEVLVRMDEGRVVVRPIAGTRPRGRTALEDEALATELRADPKEAAEHLMLLDLGRNDVGRVTRFGTVRVTERMAVERYSHVQHLVSTVEGDLREGLSGMDVLRAAFPAGTVSGAPKVRAMEIIDELEPSRRGPYAGAVGYVAHGGRSMDAAIAIRTVVATGGQAHVQAGAGIVADSDPAFEYEETLSKARALLRAVQAVS
jgi:anthranilate synthase component I